MQRIVAIVGISLLLAVAAVAKEDAGLLGLRQGNDRFVHSAARQKLAALAAGQHPGAVVVTCSDSRVAPEVVLGQGLGEIFVVRVAGNVLDTDGLGSIEYAVEHLHVPLVVVIGHEKCGAVSAAMQPGVVEGHLEALLEQIRPAIRDAAGLDRDPLAAAVKANAIHVAREIRESAPILSAAVRRGHLRVVAGYLRFDSGVLELL